MNPYIQIIAAFFGSLGFALLFNLRGRWLFFTALGGGLSWCIYLISGSFISHYERQYFAAAFFSESIPNLWHVKRNHLPLFIW